MIENFKVQRSLEMADLKVYWARKHIQDLEHVIAWFTEQNVCEVSLESVDEWNTRLKLLPAGIPAEIPLLIGDIFHDMSVALDYVAFGLMDAVGKGSYDVYFPCAKSREGLLETFKEARSHPTKKERTISAGRNQKLAKHFPAVSQVIMDEIKPYLGGDLGIWEIREADKTDKHRFLFPVIYSAEICNVQVLYSDGLPLCRLESCEVFGGGVAFPMHFADVSGLVLRYDEKPKLNMIFSEDDEVFPGKPLVPTLHRCVDSVSQAIAMIRDTVHSDLKSVGASR